MIAANYSTVRDNFKKYCDATIKDCETVIITRKMNENVVIMSEAEYRNLQENLHIRSNKANYERLLQSIENAKAGKLTSHELIGVDGGE